jgi:hypothetical protein
LVMVSKIKSKKAKKRLKIFCKMPISIIRGKLLPMEIPLFRYKKRPPI